MRYTRQNKILELIKTNKIETQQQLAEMLNAEGFNVTQATVSRDIKNLMLVKQNRGGVSCYALPAYTKEDTNIKFQRIIKDTITSIEYAENMLVIKTLSGCAGTAAEAIDMQNIDTILGTIAGDNTIFVVCKSKELAPIIAEEIKKVTIQ